MPTQAPAAAQRGRLKLLRRVYLPSAESRGRNVAHASSTRAAAPRTFSIEAFALQLVCAARAPAWSAVTPPGCARVSSSGMGSGVVSAPVAGACTGAWALVVEAPNVADRPRRNATPQEDRLAIIFVLSMRLLGAAGA